MLRCTLFPDPETQSKQEFYPLSQIPLLVLVGLTGSGKTTVSNLLAQRDTFMCLSDRRSLTDSIIIPYMQKDEGQLSPVDDRLERFKLTSRFREQFPGGIAYILGNSSIESYHKGTILLFDGMRGLDEIRYAVKNLPQALFLVLLASDKIRLLRLVSRRDPFDKVETDINKENLNPLKKIFNPQDFDYFVEEVKKGNLSQSELLQKAEIILTEQNLYQQDPVVHYLKENAVGRTLIFDTEIKSANEIANETVLFCNAHCQLADNVVT